MGMGIKIPMQIYGGDQVEAQLLKIVGGIKRVGKGYDDAAKSAKKFSDEQKRVTGGGAAPAIDPQARMAKQVISGVAPTLGGAGGMISRSAGVGLALGGNVSGVAAGAAVGGVGALVVALANAFTAAVARAEEIVSVGLQRAQGMRAKIDESGKSVGQSGVGLVGSSGLAIQRALSSGMTMDQIKGAMERGIDPESLAKVGGNSMALKAMINAQRLGVGAGQSADIIARAGGVRGTDPWKIAANIAGEAQDRVVRSDEISRAKAGSDFGRSMDNVQRLQGQLSATAIDAVTGGKAADALGDQLSRALDPVAAVMKDSYKLYLDQLEQLQAISDNTNWLRSFAQWAGYHVGISDGTAMQRLNMESAKQSAAQAAVTGAAP